MRLIAAGAIAAMALVLACMAPAALPARAQDAYVVDAFHADITVQHDGTLLIAEAIDVDFGAEQHHGVFRDIPVDYAYDAQHKRVYKLKVLSVTDAAGSRVKYTTTHTTPNIEVRIGDPGVLVTGKQSYRLTYTVAGALNAFADHDELYWNVNGPWPVPTDKSSATVALAGGGFERAQCYEGPVGSTEACGAGIYDNGAHVLFGTSRALEAGEQLTIVAGIRKGVIDPSPTPILQSTRGRTVGDFFEINPVTLAIAIAGTLAAVAFVGANWWRNGRDRVYTSIYYLSKNPEEEARPLLYRPQVVVEYTPPEELRPAQMGLLLDERTDDKDMTATIVDLAVRGYITITEVSEGSHAGHWRIAKQKKSTDDLLPYERTILEGLLGKRQEVDLSELTTDYASALADANAEINAKSVSQAWFVRTPDDVRDRWRWTGAGVLIAGGGAIFVAGLAFGAGLAVAPLALLGALMALTASWLPKRTAKGSELTRRVLGFRMYIETAEKRRQEFNEKANIFAAYLPYAIVFGCVHKWAKVFEQADIERSVAGWYTGPAAFTAIGLSHGLQSFSTSISHASFNSLVSTPGGHGRSGFFGGSGFGGGGFGGGGGFAGGGGGGGGGGAW